MSVALFGAFQNAGDMVFVWQQDWSKRVRHNRRCMGPYWEFGIVCFVRFGKYK